MSALKQFLLFISIPFIFAACSSENSDDIVKGAEEQLPKVDTSKLREVKVKGYTISVLKQMTANRVSGDVLFSADYLPKEYHVNVSKTPVKRFAKDDEFPTKKDDRLKWFAQTKSQELQDHLMSLDQEPMQQVVWKNKNHFKQTLKGKEFGFPLEKVYYLRFYQEENAFVSVVCWTTNQNAKKFEKYAQYMGMTIH